MQVWRLDFLASILMKNSIGSPILIGTPATARWSKPKLVLKRQIQSTTSCWFDKYKYNRQIQIQSTKYKYKYNRPHHVGFTNTIDKFIQTQIQSTTSCWSTLCKKIWIEIGNKWIVDHWEQVQRNEILDCGFRRRMRLGKKILDCGFCKNIADRGSCKQEWGWETRLSIVKKILRIVDHVKNIADCGDCANKIADCAKNCRLWRLC